MNLYTSNLPIINADENGIYIDEYDLPKYVSNERLMNFIENYYDDFKYDYDYLEKIANEKEY